MMSPRRDRNASPIRIAVVGCGAIARSFHLPALTRDPEVRKGLTLVDRDLERAVALSKEFDAGGAVADHREILHEVDGAIVAVPEEFHGRITLDFLRAGVPVLCEKPLSTTLQEASELVEESRRMGAPLGVNNVRRAFPAVREVRERIRSGQLGALRRIEIYEGSPFDWPLASGGTFGRGGTGRGVLQDLGAHVLDMVCWWLGERPRITEYLDDSMGGSEGVARVEFVGPEMSGLVHLSWLSHLGNCFRVEGERESVEAEIRAWDRMKVTRAGERTRTRKLRPDVPSYPDVKTRMIGNFLDVVRGDASFLVPAEEVLSSIGMIEECYGRRRRLPLPWFDTPREADHVAI